MINLIWLFFFGCAALSALYQVVFQGNTEVLGRVVNATFEMTTLSVTIAIGLIGTLCFWLGMLKIAEEAGIINRLARGLAPLFRHLMPDVPHNHPVLGSITMNLAANVFGLDNAATPFGLKAMQELQTLNKTPDTASNAQILFMVLNASSVTLLPVSILMYRAQLGSPDAASIFMPILLATSASTLTGLFVVALWQRLPVWNKTVLAYLLGAASIIGGLIYLMTVLPPAERAAFSSTLAHSFLLLIIFGFLTVAAFKKVPVYEVFIEGAKEGFQIAISLIPYLVAMLVAVGMLRASGALDFALAGLKSVAAFFAFDTKFIDAMPTALIKPFSGSGARAMMLETMKTHGVDSFAGKLAATIQGSTETTFYIVAVYFGAVGIRKTRHAIPCALLADAAGVIAAITVAYWLF